MPIKFFVIVFLLVLTVHSSYAQDDRNSIEITPVGGIKVFTSNENHLKGNLWGTEVAYHFNMRRDKAPYARIFNLQSIDAVFSYRNMEQLILNNDRSSKGILGSTYSLLGRIEVSLLKAGPAQLLLTPGIGILYSTQSYFTDNRNSITGSHLNMASQVGLKVFVAATPSVGVQAGVDVFHYSNGAIRLPNNGINAYSVSLGIVRKINQHGSSNIDSSAAFYRHSLEFGADIGSRGIFKQKEGNYKSGFYLGYNYQLNQVLSFKLATDAVYYYTLFDANRFNQTFQYYATSYDRWRVGMSLGVDVWLGKLAVTANYGHYLHYKSYYPDNQSYWTAGLKYYIKPWVGIQVKGYIHHTQADYIGTGLIFRIH